MKNTFLLLLVVLFVELAVCTPQKFSNTEISEQINYLHKRLDGPSYWDHDQSYRFMLTWQHMKGIYQSRVHFNILDKKNRIWTSQLRQNLFKIDDINMFVSSFVLYGLLEAQSLGTIKIDDHKFSQTLEAITQFRDKNTPPGIPQYLFWPQTNENGTWTARSVNLLNIIALSPSFPPSWNDWLTKHGLGILTMVKKFADFFCIPPDNDDSGVNLALLGLMKETNSSHFGFFDSFNYNKVEFYNRVLKYAYRPFESNFTQNKRCNQIDPRTYYVLHDFIISKKEQALAKNETTSLILPTTWLLNEDQEKPGKIFMPFETNNVDATVSANFLLGLTFQIMIETLKPADLPSDLIKMIHDTVDLIEYVIQTVSKDRFDLILVYYPSKYDFYWFVSRIVNLLKRNLSTKLQNPEYADFKTVYERLNKLMKSLGTQNILQNKKNFEKSSEAVLWQEFLGNYGKKDRHEDALFSTALALNALFDTWTTKSGSKLTYDADTPQEVKTTIQKGVLYLQKFIKKQMNSKQNICYFRTGYRMKLENAFFSGSMKIFKTSFPYFYPANIHYDKEGKNFDPTTMSLKDLQFGSKYYVKGFIESSEYKDMLAKKWFGSEVPTQFKGFNDGVGLTFPYWSSKAISEIMMITALSKYVKVSESALHQKS